MQAMNMQKPAPATIGATKEGVLANLAFFFGDPVVPQKLRDYSEHHAMTYHFPDAYYGQNTKIRDTLNNLITKSPQEWHTQVALPFVKIVGTTVEWDEIRFDVRLLQRVPYEGVSRMSTSLRRRHRDRVVRRGIGLTIESDFYATEAGREHFSDQLKSIRYCVQETCNFDAIFAYLTCGNYDFRYDLQKGLRPRRSVRTAMAHEINMFAIVQKDQMGLDKAVETTKYRMSRYSVNPNMLIIPPQLALYVSLAPEQKLTYPLAGPEGSAAFAAGTAGFEAKAFRGLGVFTSSPYEVSDDQDSVQMLQRGVQVGEFYRMSPPAVFNANKKLPSAYMDIMIYDEESDRHVHISFEEALNATTLGEDDGVTGAGFKLDRLDEHSRKLFLDHYAACTKTEVAMPDEEEERAEEGKSAPTAARIRPSASWEAESTVDAGTVANLDLTTKTATGDDVLRMLITAKNAALRALLLKLVAFGIYVPISIVIARPFIEHLMLSAIVTVAGRDTGATLFGPADMQISANTSVKTIEGHYTCHTKSVITKQQNVCVMRDIMCSGYIAGCNTRFFGSNPSPAKGKYTADAIKEAMTKRLAFDEDDDGGYDSMLAFCAPLNDATQHSRDQVISITSRVLPWETNHTDPKHFPGGSVNFTEYNDALDLDQIHFGEDNRALENNDYMSQGAMNNSLCFVGPHRKYNPYGSQYHELVPGQGHFGPDAIPGDARWRRGETVSLKAARDTMVSLEVAAHSQLYMSKSTIDNDL